MANGPYSRVYWSIVDDPMFADVWDDNDALATWLRLLLLADQTYPASAPLPHRSPSIKRLITAGLLLEPQPGRYLIRGMAAERERRSSAGRNAAAVRWQSDRSARRDETRQDETSARGRAVDEMNGSQPPATFMGYKPSRPPFVPDLKAIDRLHEQERREAHEAVARREAEKRKEDET